MKYAVDRIENNIVILENINNKEIREVNIKKIGFNINEGDILVFKNNRYYKDDKEKKNRISLLQEKLNKVKNIK